MRNLFVLTIIIALNLFFLLYRWRRGCFYLEPLHWCLAFNWGSGFLFPNNESNMVLSFYQQESWWWLCTYRVSQGNGVVWLGTRMIIMMVIMKLDF